MQFFAETTQFSTIGHKMVIQSCKKDLDDGLPINAMTIYQLQYSLYCIVSRLVNIFLILIIMHSDENTQEKGQKFIATISSGKLLLEINDLITYKGELDLHPSCDATELKGTFERGQIQILTKTTSKLVIKLGFFKVEMLSEDSHQIKALKAKIAQLEQKLQQQWEDESLDSKDNFDLDCIYRVASAGSGSFLPTVTPSALYFNVGAAYSISTSNRRSSTAGLTITRIQRKRV